MQGARRPRSMSVASVLRQGSQGCRDFASKCRWRLYHESTGRCRKGRRAGGVSAWAHASRLGRQHTNPSLTLAGSGRCCGAVPTAALRHPPAITAGGAAGARATWDVLVYAYKPKGAGQWRASGHRRCMWLQWRSRPTQLNFHLGFMKRGASPNMAAGHEEHIAFSR